MGGADQISVLHEEFAGGVIQPTTRMGAYVEPSLNFFIITIKQDSFVFTVNDSINGDYLPIWQVFA